MPTVAVRHRHVLNHFFLLEIILCDRNRITLTGVSVSLRQLSKKVQAIRLVLALDNCACLAHFPQA